jgi:Virulence factor
MSTPGRRARNRCEVVTIWWRDIPTQVNGVNGSQIEKYQLSHRFLWSAQRAAKKADLMDAHSFTEQSRRTAVTFDPASGDLLAAVEAEAARLEDLYDDDKLTILVEAGGLAVDAAPQPRPRLRIVAPQETSQRP